VVQAKVSEHGVVSPVDRMAIMVNSRQSLVLCDIVKNPVPGYF